MTRLAIAVVGAQPSAQSAAPGITFRLRIQELLGGRVHALALRCQVRIEPRGRAYTAEEQGRLYELFGAPPQWHRTLQPVTWAHVPLMVSSFERQVEVDLPVPCTYDLELASAKYLHAIRGGEVPIVMLFTGTAFCVEDAAFRVDPVSWDLEAPFRLPSAVWHAAMDQFFPGGGWLRLSRETIDRLQAYRGRQAVVTWDEAIDRLLEGASLEQRA